MNRVKLIFSLLSTLPGAVAADFARDVAPLLDRYCADCHSDKTKTSGFSVSTMESVLAGGKKHGTAVIGGDPAKSPLLQLIKGELAPRMPVGGSLTKADLDLIEDWVRSLPAEQARTKPTWRWPFEKPVKPAIPDIGNSGWARNPIDAFIVRKLEDSGLRPAPEASKPTLARRVYFDLIGLPPTPDELATFLADNSPEAYPKLIDKLLEDPRYGERWGRHWLDLVRYGETSGLEGDGAIGNAWRYRDWVIQAFNDDLPYDRFVIKQLGGADEHSRTRNNYAPDVQGHVPLGFFRVAPWDRSNLVADEVRQNYLSEVTTATGSIFLGLTVGCARCHDHKYDPIPQRDFYRFQAFFNAVQVENVEVPYKDATFAATAKTKIQELETRLKEGPEKKDLDRFEADLLVKLIVARKEQSKGKEIGKDDLRLELRRKPLAVFTESERRRYADLKEDADRTLDPEERKGLDVYEATLLKKMVEARPDPLARFDALTVEDVRAELGKRESRIFSATEREQHQERSEKLDVLRRRLGRWKPLALTIKNVPGPPNGPNLPPTHLLVRGDYRNPAEQVTAGFPAAIAGKEEAALIESDRYRQFPTRGWRLTLAKWIASPQNPLTARVMVNRIWQHHFGLGIVGTPNDFGVNGERPTHPELLDWLAHRFVDEGWSVKAMHRLMLTSSTFKQSAENSLMAANTKDPENRLLWKFNRRRLEAESIRDSILHVSGRLSLERGGPSVFPPLPDDLADSARYGRGGALMWEPNEKELESRRRSVYTFQRRSMPLPMMLAFDAPVFSESCDRRSVTTTPLQALSMMNGSLVQEEAGHLAQRIESSAGSARPAQIRRAFQIAFSREPMATEMDKFQSFEGPLAAICRVLLNSNEFLYVD